MQLIEVTDFGVRSAAVWLQRRETPLRFALFPMVHLGTAAFYADVTRRLRKCQLIVAEGVAGRSVVVTALTLAYRIPGRARRDGLVGQSLDLRSLNVATISPDVDAAQFGKGWRRLPIWFRLVVLLLTPLVGLWLTVVGPRRAFTRSLAMDDLPTRDEMAMSTGLAGKLDEMIVDERDERLLRCLDEIHHARCDEPIDVAVVYGAQHMRAVVRHLGARYGYWARDAEWMTVLTF